VTDAGRHRPGQTDGPVENGAMHDDHLLVEGRIRRELDERVRPAIHAERVPLAISAWTVPGEPVPHAEAMVATYESVPLGSWWGRPWGTTWFRFSGTVPDGWVGSEIEAVIDLGFGSADPGFQAEGLVWTADGPRQGVHPRRTAVPLPEAKAGEAIEVVLEAASNPWFPSFRPSPMGALATAPDAPLYRLRRADLAVLDRAVYDLVLDIEVLEGTMLALPADDPRRARLLRTLEHAFDVLDLSDVGATAPRAREVLAPALALPARAGAHTTVAVGHAHIDTAWLWPLREAVRKCTRTFASALRLMDDEPDYRFVCSQAAQYEWMRRRHPGLFASMQERAAAGQWIPVGGMWVEADMNLPGGESIVRQLVHGQRFFEEHFGRRCSEIWIPDAFGYPASLPQIFAAGGCRRFVTQKLSWNKENRFPHSTFWWEGIDGTRVLTHFPPVETYNAAMEPLEQIRLERQFHEHGWSDWSLTPYGYGDGGGGPTREMVGRARRMADLDGLPRLELGTVDGFFAAVEEEAAAGAPVPVWRGELYFEMHRGTLTSQIRTKLGNRRCERLLFEAELWWSALRDGPDRARAAVVMAELDQLWKDVLVQQFHDILPGSSIAWVHAEAEAEHARIAARLEQLVEDALVRVAPGPIAVASARSRPAREMVVVPEAAPGAGGPTQVLTDGSVAFVAEVPACGAVAALPVAIDDEVAVTDHSLVNRQLSVSWDRSGSIVSIRSIVHERELVPAGRAVALELAPDHPVEYDAWDLERWTRGLGQSITVVDAIDVVERGPLLGAVRVTRTVGPSTFATTYRLAAGSSRLDVVVDVDWHHDEHLLSLAVPLDVHADHALCDIQLGVVRRPTHASSSWDAAKFEICSHRFVDLAEPSFGVAVLNDGRWGHALQGDAVCVSLLRAAKYPDPDADHGRHSVTVALLPHGPGLQEVLAAAEALNRPLRVVAGGTATTALQPLVTLDHPGVELDAVKAADDGSGELVVRLHEAVGDRATVRLELDRPVEQAWRATIFEDRLDELGGDEGRVRLTLQPFELATVRIRTTG
jgi:alpha-mannosidase